MEQQNFQEATVMAKKSGMVTAGLVLGIVGICTSFIPIVNNASFVLGILAAVFGLIGLLKKKSTAKAVCALILGVLAVVITLAMQSSWQKELDDLGDDLDYMSGGKTNEILADYLDVTIGSFEVSGSEGWESTELSVTLKNKGNEQKSFDVTIEAIDKDGNRIDTDIIYAGNLGAGQSQRFKIFTLVTSDKIAELKTATFRVVEASMY